MLGYSIKENSKYCQHQKKHIVLWKKTLNYLKNPNDIDKLHPDFPEE